MIVVAAGIAIGMASGAFNGFFVAVLGMQPIVVTLATMFILQGVTLLDHGQARRQVAPALGDLLIGDAIPNLLPKPASAHRFGSGRVGLAQANQFRHSRSTRSAATSRLRVRSGCRRAFVLFMVYVIGGGCYGLAGVFISAQTGSGDPLIGNPMLLQMFAAVVVGGTKLGGGRGGPLGTVFGAYILMMVVNILLVLNVSAYYSTVAEGVDPHPCRARWRVAAAIRRWPVTSAT